jgi:hypothetical protein
VVALEALLLPEMMSGLGKTFARRIAALLAPKDDSEVLEQTARALYDARSASLHGGSRRLDAAAAAPAYAQRLLAAAIEALAADVSAGDGDIAAVCAGLDEGPGPEAARFPDPGDLAGLQATDRLRARTPKDASGFSLGGPTESMEAQEGTRLSWSPLVGLTCDGSLDFGGGSGVFLVSATPATVLTIEDKDVRRELGNLMLVETPVACLGVVRELTDDEPGQREEMLRTRDLAVVALRLSGFRAFADPELLGSYVYTGSMRTIDTTVFAQTVLRGMGWDHEESFGENDVEHFQPDWALVTEYDARTRNDEIDHVLTLYRRAHDSEYLPPDARASLLLGVMEAMLGRFRPRDDPVQLEDLVSVVAGDDAAAAWFVEHGRTFRNAVAHGRWDHDPEPLATMETLLRPLVRAFLQAWLAEDDHERRPGRVLIERVAAAGRA